MVTVHRERGLRIVIYKEDHEPAHVHVYGDGEAKVALRYGDGKPRLVWSKGMGLGEQRQALRIVAGQHTKLLAKWSEIHG